MKPLCVDAALANYTQHLLDLALDAQQRMEALMFVIHFVGDAHARRHGVMHGPDFGTYDVC